ncbi:SDR family NAD(P)-dependent oxidoreductase [Streptomyces sp. URMC 126]|uniref:type I polyketide synthase n=1 Tax=Streptomyces sp. URMC 126 TaxID=3423401 RepID=UPI003F1D6FB2
MAEAMGATDPAGDAAGPGDGRRRPTPLTDRLAALPPEARYAVLLELVREKTAELLGTDPHDISPDLAYRDFGYNSLAALELTGNLAAATGLDLPLTVLFDHPSPAAVAAHLLASLGWGPEAEAVPETPADPSAGSGPDDPVAVVGMACRYPGGIASPADLWDAVAAGRDLVSGFPADRGWDLDRLFSDDPERPGTCYARAGGFLDPVADFDADFFGVSRREALAMDPQQRLLLHTVWEALEHAGIDPGTLRKSPTGVFVGSSGQDYEQVARSGPHELEGYWGIGSAGSVLSGRVAYVFGFEGPALTVDTACSSSLVSVHLAARALRAGECSLALAGGVAVMATPKVFTEFSRQRALSPDGRCRSYAEAADGTGWAEGVGVLVLERLSEARRRGHRVLALLPGSAVNQDGASNGLTAPSGAAQQRVVGQALAAAGLRPGDVDAVEGHGTGTTLGDPIEIDSLAAVFGGDRPAGRPLRLGSLKSNIGHSQAAAGVGGLIKMIMALRHGVLPRTLHVDRPTPKADWSSGAVSLLREPVPWPRGERIRRAGVSAFGVGGTNAHVLVEEAPADDAKEAPAGDAKGAPAGDVGAAAPADGPEPAPDAAAPPAVPWLLSAKSPAALRDQARRLYTHLTTRPDTDTAPADVGAALALTRAHFDHRAAVTGTSRAELLDGIAGLARGEATEGTAVGRAGTGGKVVFVFPGQGSQWLGMSRELASREPVFADELRACAEALAPHVAWSLDEVLRGAPGAPSLDRVDVVQPALFAVMAALAALWRRYGVRPDAVVGHSQGEIAAAYVAGGLSLEDAARVVALRSRAIAATMAGRGGMASVTAPPERLLPLLGRWDGHLSVAAVNGPSSLTVSGDPRALDELLARCAEEGFWARRVPVDYASHSAQAEAVEEELAEVLAPLAPRSGTVAFHSTVTAGLFDTAGLDAGYWYRNLRRTVRFDEVVRGLLDTGHTTFVEVSPHPILTVALEQTVEAAGAPAAVLATSRRDGEAAAFTAALAAAHVHGAPVAWDAVFDAGAARRAELPTYAFQSERYWAAPRPTERDADGAGRRPTGHPLLTWVTELAYTEGRLLGGRISRDAHPWLDDHAVHDTVLVPGTAFVDMAALAAGRAGCDTVAELTLEKPLALAAGAAFDLQAVVGAPDERGARPVSVHARPAGAADGEEWTRHATGFLTAAAPPDTPPPPAAWPPPGATPVSLDGLYDRLADRGFGYGPAFRGLRAAWRQGDDLLAEVDTTEDADGFGIHPALLDAAFHARLPETAGTGTADAADTDGVAGTDDRSYKEGASYEGGAPGKADTFGGDDASAPVWLPFVWSGVRIARPGATRLRVTLTGLGEGVARMSATDETGAPVVSVASVTARPVSAAALASVRPAADALFRLAWQPVAAPERPDGTGAVRGADVAVAAPEHPGATGAAPATDVEVATTERPNTPGANVKTAAAEHPDATGATPATDGAVATPERPDTPGADVKAAAPEHPDATDTALDANVEVTKTERPGAPLHPDGDAPTTKHPNATCTTLATNSKATPPTEPPSAPTAVLSADGKAPAYAAGLPVYPDVAALAAAATAVPETVLVPVPAPRGADADEVRAVAHRTLALLQAWLADERLAGSRLVLVTRGAVAVAADEAVRPGLAPLWGLVRSAQAEHPGRFALVDLDDADHRRLPLALLGEEPQLAVRGGTAYAPRVVRAGAAGEPLPFDPDGTVLVTGGTGGIGALVARHLVVEHGARHLLLAGRRGTAAEGVAELVAELRSSGAEVTVAACDVTDRAAVAGLLASVPPEHPLTSVVHSAGVLDDGLVEALTPERLDGVLRPKTDAVLHLHELTAGAPLRSFVLFSSVAGTVGGPGQGNYAAANTFLDAFAHWRRARGLPAVSLAWGLWEETSAMTRHLAGEGVARLGRSGLAPLATGEALRLFDAAHGTGDALLLPARFDAAALRAQGRDGMLPAPLRALAPAPAGAADKAGTADRAGTAGATLPARLAAAPAEERDALVAAVVTAEVAALLGHEDASTVDAERPFKELGLDSLGAVRLRNRLSRVTGLSLPSTLVFGHPTVPALAARLRALLEERAAPDEPGSGTSAVLADLDRLAALLPSVPPSEADAVGARLRALLAAVERPDPGDGDGRRIEDATADELFDLIDRDLGVA